MKKALTQINEQRLNPVSSEQNDSTKNKHFPPGYNSQKALEELARKWVRYGSADTPNEAIKMLLEGVW